MGRPPSCEKRGVKKGPWTPEEDIVLVSYIQERGPGNWRAVPSNTGLLRCSKSCRLRWTNYLRPGIKRGNFTEHEERMIIHLQALLGNRWAAIASYVPQRTDNDIKNYWNTHLKKKLNKLQGRDDQSSQHGHSVSQSISIKGQWERRLQTDIHTAKQALCEALSLDKSGNLPESKPFNGCYKLCPRPARASSYAWSTDNIARLLQNWTKSSPKSSQSCSELTQNSYNHPPVTRISSPTEGTASAPKAEVFDSLFSFNSSHSDDASWSASVDETTTNFTAEIALFQDESKPNFDSQMPLTLLEKWLFDDTSAQGQEGLMDMYFGETAELF